MRDKENNMHEESTQQQHPAHVFCDMFLDIKSTMRYPRSPLLSHWHWELITMLHTPEE